MNAPFAPPETVDVFMTAAHAVNAWRGRCIDMLAMVESAVSEALVRLQPAGDAKYPHLVGQRLQALVDVLSHRDDLRPVLAALEQVRNYSALRTALCHGKAKVTLDRSGRWHAIFRMTRFEGGKAVEDIRVFEQRQAETLMRDVVADCRRLVDLLRSAIDAG